MNDSYMYLLVKSILTLVFILGLLGVALYALKRFMKGQAKGKNGAAADPIRVVATSFLGPKKNIAVVEVAGEMLVLGLTPTSITFLSRVEGTEAVEELRKLKDSKRRPFLSILQGGL
ncbi:MAG TPA: flagellar biosynthetic protein FliO [Deltaproteobacteria bacterium]|nr:MAG: flagellar biosynthetic protein FliO [Deltaproteobacteria bacterium GWA2_55_82]OIJ72838.1 MAG: flagellar biosynthetic protein FliO [Deltaproteobacteria bacterium GWC2_55_46]HBG46117.1 flagellar biosynthetic protein FliO [Deltaproteobacteria bacterium]HCY11615.1 flagellar biosynthetic protein FliO [Deltaproteobacteria bacterium]